jgi:hypothetical protein
MATGHLESSGGGIPSTIEKMLDNYYEAAYAFLPDDLTLARP